MAKEAGRTHAVLVGAGILCSRIFWLVRQRVFSHFFGLSDAADIFSSALRVRNFLQNLFGEGVLSASFIPVYAGLLGQGRREEAGRLAGAIAAILALLISVIVAVGIMATPWLLWLIAPGYAGEKRELTILIVRILFPGTGVLVWSAWCLGILNSHHRFFLSYVAPVVWNLSMIATLLIFRKLPSDTLIVYLAWGTVLGCLLQFLVQLPSKTRVRVHLIVETLRESRLCPWFLDATLAAPRAGAPRCRCLEVLLAPDRDDRATDMFENPGQSLRFPHESPRSINTLRED